MAQEGGIIQQYKKALEINPKDTDTRYQLGVALLREKSYKEALSHLLKVYPKRAGEAGMNYNIGLAYAGAGELRKAFEHYKKADEINPIDAKDKFHLELSFYNLGVAYQKNGELDEALKAYKESIRINPGEAIAYCTKGEVHYQKKEYDNALEDFMVCREKEPDRKGVNRYISAIHLDKGINHLNQDKYAEARTELEKAIDFDRDNEAVYYYMGYLDYRQGNYKKALSSLDKMKETGREDMKKAVASLLYNIGGGMIKNEEWEGAITSFSLAASIDNKDPELHFYMGYSYMKAEKFGEAAAEYKETLRLNPKHQKAAVNLAIVSEMALKSHLGKGSKYLQDNLCKEALKEFSSALSIDPQNQWALENKESSERCIERFSAEAEEQRKRDIALKLFEGDKFLISKKYLEAKRSYEAVISLEPENIKAQEGAKKASSLIKETKEKHTLAGEKAFADGKYYNAALEYKAVLALDPEDKTASARLDESLRRLFEFTSPLLNEAKKYEDNGAFLEAIAVYNKIIDIQPDHMEAVKRKSRATEELDKAFNEAFTKGKEHSRAGDYMKAAEYFETALKLKPYNDIVMEELKAASGRLKKVVDIRLAEASSSLKTGRYADAITNYKAVLLIDRENKEAASGLQNAIRLRDEIIGKKMLAGITSYKDGDFIEAITAFGEVLRIDPNNGEAMRMQRDAKAKIDDMIIPWLKEGEDAYKKGNIETAIISFKKVLNIDPRNRQAKEYLGKIDTQKTKVSVAKEVEKHYLSGIELYTAGKYREAIESWKKVIEIDPGHEKALLNIEKTKRKMEGVMDTR